MKVTLTYHQLELLIRALLIALRTPGAFRSGEHKILQALTAKLDVGYKAPSR
jgi:hypothetical protein